MAPAASNSIILPPHLQGSTTTLAAGTTSFNFNNNGVLFLNNAPYGGGAAAVAAGPDPLGLTANGCHNGAGYLQRGERGYVYFRQMAMSYDVKLVCVTMLRRTLKKKGL